MSANLSAFQHPRFARMYQRISAESELRGTAEHRDRALEGLSGRVLEVGAGNGMNFRHYPSTVEQVVAVEPEDILRSLAERAAATGRTRWRSPARDLPCGRCRASARPANGRFRPRPVKRVR